MPESLVTALREAPWVADAGTLNRRRVEVAGRPVTLMGIDVQAFARNAHLPMGDTDPAAAYAAVASGEVLVSETLAYPLGLRVGGNLRLPTRSGTREFSIAAIVQNYGEPSGAVYLHRETYRRVYGAEPVLSVALWLAEGVDPAGVAARVERLPGGNDVRVVPNASLHEEAMRVFDRTFAITEMMRVISALVAFVAVVSALMALVTERQRVIGMLRATGMAIRPVGTAIAVEAGLLALSAALMAWVLGLGMAVVMVFVVNPRAFGWTLQFHPGQGPYLGVLWVALGAAWLGSLIPVLHAARLPVLSAIREE